MDPNRPDRNQQESELTFKNLVWVKFWDDFDASDISADTIAQFFSKFGDFHVYRDTKQSCILNFYYLDKSYIINNSINKLVEMLNGKCSEQDI